IAEPAGGEPERAQRRDEIGDVEPSPSALPRVKPQADQYAKKAAVETHSALPHLEDLERMNQVIERLVEEHVAEPAAEDHAEHAVEQHVIDVARMPARQQILSRAFAAEDDEQNESDEVHETVPADCK